MDKTYKTPECEVVNLICGGAVIMQSGGEQPSGTVEDWFNDGRGNLTF